MALKKQFRCTICEASFAPYQWVSADGHRHAVERKTYYSPSANWRTYVAEERLEKLEDGRNKLVPARGVQFGNGVYSTTDPEEQYALDSQCSMTYEEWQKAFIPKEELMLKKERELKAKEAALLQRENELLAKVKEVTK